eukprot:m.253164 g.253164  ORF g.253164 m.253164 type:complete len:624 (+) comp19577_c1_seq7:174-2045(+)
MSSAAAPRLQQLRALFRQTQILPPGIKELAGYIVPSEDAHSSEYLADCDCRRAFITGFTGSKGLGVITETSAGMYTDGRYFLQAEAELLPGWELLRMGESTTPSQSAWFLNSLGVKKGPLDEAEKAIGVDPSLISAPAFRDLQAKLRDGGCDLVAVPTNLVDLVWDSARPARPMNKILCLGMEHTGMDFSAKLDAIRSSMRAKGCEMLVLTALDEIAYAFNLRGSDIPYNPVFYAFAIVTETESILYVDHEKLPEECTASGSAFQNTMTVRPYDAFITDLADRQCTGSVWVGPRYSQAVADALSSAKLCEEETMVCHMKSIKNAAELNGMRQCHLRDAVALAEFFCWLEGEMATGNPRHLTESDVSDKLEGFRKEMDGFVTPSFATISSTGSNGAVIHYHPHPETAKVISPDEVYLLDSGGQYHDGTTDVTRTVHFRTPTDHERNCFTRVLQGHIALSTAVFPQGTTGLLLDSFARRPLWEAGLDYRHGTGHGVGSFLNVHEGPIGISFRMSSGKHPLKSGMIVTIEPGYYEDGNFGIRIENVVEVIERTPDGRTEPSLAFQPCTYFPIQAKMIDVTMLTSSERQWVDEYHQTTLRVLSPLLSAQGRTKALAWLEANTRPLEV